MLGKILPAVSAFAALSLWTAASAGEPKIDFDRQIKPILADKCFACHGPDEESREAGLRFDTKEGAFAETESGGHAIVPGDLKASLLVQRIATDDSSEVMPPEDFEKKLTAEEIQLLRAWVKQGAPWSRHWAYVTPKRPPLPPATPGTVNAIDRFIRARLQKEKLEPSPPADKITLLRRVTFDLTGLPPTPEEIAAFLADDSPDAYERVVDRLLESPRYGEHRARYWLDAARYGDTHGLHLDNYREMWLYRDWVVRAFNENKPYDTFIIEQLAGDLLPNPTIDQLIATGFNRCHVTTNEGGSIVEEVYVRNVVDRVVTFGTVFMGMTFDCSRCHDHKYDPFTMKDFYSLFAYFNSLDGSPMDKNIKDPPPVIRVFQPDQKRELEAIDRELKELKTKIREAVAGYTYEEPRADAPPKRVEVVWIEDTLPLGAKPQGGWQFVSAPQPVFSGEKASTRTASGLSQHFFVDAKDPIVIQEGDILFAHVFLDPDNPPQEIMLQWNDGSWSHRAYWGKNLIAWGKDGSAERYRMGDLPEKGTWVRLEVAAEVVGLKPGSKVNGWAFTQFDGTVYWDRAGVERKSGYRSFASWLEQQRKQQGKGLPAPLQKLVQTKPDQLKPDQERKLREHFIEFVLVDSRPLFDPLHQRRKQLEERRQAIEKAAPTTLIFREKSPPKPAFVLNRGEYDQPREPVTRRTPLALPPMPKGAPNNRLGLAQWLVAPEHPLTSRVAVNSFWQQLFGTGLVKTAEDFGVQGERPSHPELLDWLAVDFRESGWDVKRLIKMMVMSATYRQSSRVRDDLRVRDPENRLLARGPRFRLDAEMLRDQALAVSGLLVEKLGGPSVKPPQPDGLWFAVGYTGSNTVRFKPDHGPDKVHRRTLYTFLKRTAPPPQLSTFDAPSRESACVRRERTNTPLQALLLMNDPQYVEAARALATRVMREASGEPAAIAGRMFQLATCRPPRPEETAHLVQLFDAQRKHYAQDAKAASQLLAVGEFPTDKQLPQADLAAWTIVANLILNLDEVVTKN